MDRSLPFEALSHLNALRLLDLRFNGKLKASEATSLEIANRLPLGAACTILLTEVVKGEAKPSAATRDARLLRCQLEPLSTPTLARRLKHTFGVSTHPDTVSRDDLLRRLVECYSARFEGGSRPKTRIAGAPLGPSGRALLPLLLTELRATSFPSGEQRERPKIRAEGYIILQRPKPSEEAALRTVERQEDDATGVAGMAAAAVESKGGTAKAKLALAKLRRHARIWQLAYEILEEADPAYAAAFTAVAVTKQFQGSPHIDTENVAPFYGLAIGEYSGGFICVESEDGLGVYEVDTQHRFGKVDGRYPHWVAPHTGERYSLIYYQTSGEVVPQGPSVFAKEQPEAERREAWSPGGVVELGC